MYCGDLIKLLQTEGIGRKTIINLKKYIENENYKSIDYQDCISIIEKMTKKKAKVNYEKARVESEKILENCYNENIRIITCFDKDFPCKLKEIGDDSPAIIYVKGDNKILYSKQNIAVVGTRYPTEEGYKKGFYYSEFMAMMGINIISGLAIGCDTSAHEGALRGDGKTLAVLPSGIGHIYPKTNKNLYDRLIWDGGCVLSEMPPFSPPYSFSFIERDRLQSSLAEGVFIIESPLKSGTYHTYKYCLKYGKEIAASMHKSKKENLELNNQIIDSDKGCLIRDTKELKKWLIKLQLEVKR
jgi:DNA processing protein